MLRENAAPQSKEKQKMKKGFTGEMLLEGQTKPGENEGH